MWHLSLQQRLDDMISDESTTSYNEGIEFGRLEQSAMDFQTFDLQRPCRYGDVS
jgi:hypothetical protein